MHPDLSLGLTAQISKWRAKRKGSYLFTLYEGKMRLYRLFNSMLNVCIHVFHVLYFIITLTYVSVSMKVFTYNNRYASHYFRSRFGDPVGEYG